MVDPPVGLTDKATMRRLLSGDELLDHLAAAGGRRGFRTLNPNDAVDFAQREMTSLLTRRLHRANTVRAASQSAEGLSRVVVVTDSLRDHQRVVLARNAPWAELESGRRDYVRGRAVNVDEEALLWRLPHSKPGVAGRPKGAQHRLAAEVRKKLHRGQGVGGFVKTYDNQAAHPSIATDVKTRTLTNLSRWPEHKVEKLHRALKGLPATLDLSEAFEITRSLPTGMWPRCWVRRAGSALRS
jgi:hypothetical protein